MPDDLLASLEVPACDPGGRILAVTSADLNLLVCGSPRTVPCTRSFSAAVTRTGPLGCLPLLVSPSSPNDATGLWCNRAASSPRGTAS
jgi:hypothetical protein